MMKQNMSKYKEKVEGVQYTIFIYNANSDKKNNSLKKKSNLLQIK